MATLTEASIVARKGIRYGIYLLIFLIIARYAFQTAVSLYRRMFPPPPPAPTVKWGKLPELPFPEKEIPENISFKLETVDGNLPSLSKQARVYFMPAKSSSINVIDQAKARSKEMGFDYEGKPVVETIPNVYVFKRGNSPSQLTMNIITGIFSISYDLNSDPTPLNSIPPSPETAIKRALAFLKSGGIEQRDLIEDGARHQYLRVEEGKLVPAVSQSEANLVKVNLFRAPYEEIPSVSPKYPLEANVWFTLSGSGGVRNVIAGEYHYYQIDEKKHSTYPLISSEDAWNKLKSGEGYISNIDSNDFEVVVRNIYLAYYDPGQYTEFYQPVIVFEGDNDFAAFVPAVTSEFYENVHGGSE